MLMEFPASGADEGVAEVDAVLFRQALAVDEPAASWTRYCDVIAVPPKANLAAESL